MKFPLKRLQFRLMLPDTWLCCAVSVAAEDRNPHHPFLLQLESKKSTEFHRSVKLANNCMHRQPKLGHRSTAVLFVCLLVGQKLAGNQLVSIGFFG